MPNLASYKEHSKASASAPLSAASIFAGNQFSKYAIIGILAFLLGVFVTVMCNMISKRNRGMKKMEMADNAIQLAVTLGCGIYCTAAAIKNRSRNWLLLAFFI